MSDRIQPFCVQWWSDGKQDWVTHSSHTNLARANDEYGAAVAKAARLRAIGKGDRRWRLAKKVVAVSFVVISDDLT